MNNNQEFTILIGEANRPYFQTKNSQIPNKKELFLVGSDSPPIHVPSSPLAETLSLWLWRRRLVSFFPRTGNATIH